MLHFANCKEANEGLALPSSLSACMVIAVYKCTNSVLQSSQVSQHCSITHTYPIPVVSGLTAISRTCLELLCICEACCAGKLHLGST